MACRARTRSRNLVDVPLGLPQRFLDAHGWRQSCRCDLPFDRRSDRPRDGPPLRSQEAVGIRASLRDAGRRVPRSRHRQSVGARRRRLHVEPSQLVPAGVLPDVARRPSRRWNTADHPARLARRFARHRQGQAHHHRHCDAVRQLPATDGHGHHGLARFGDGVRRCRLGLLRSHRDRKLRSQGGRDGRRKDRPRHRTARRRLLHRAKADLPRFQEHAAHRLPRPGVRRLAHRQGVERVARVFRARRALRQGSGRGSEDPRRRNARAAHRHPRPRRTSW